MRSSLLTTLTRQQKKRFFSTFNNNDGKLVFGCGSNVVDQIFKVQNVPKTGEKGYFQSPTKILEKSVVGGVTLNHLSWAALLGVPTGLFGMQGTDAAGRIIQEKLQELNINQDYVYVDEELTTAESYVFVQRDGEKSIVMATGATSVITGDVVTKYFGDAIRKHTSMLTTEISQVPLSGVIQLLRMAKEAGVLTVVDFDVTPSVAINEAGLGDLHELKKIIQLTDVLKPAKHAAHELLTLLKPDLRRSLSGEDIMQYLQEISGSKLVAMTNGSKESFISTEHHLVKIPSENIEQVIDATGAGDAFLGGIIAGLHYNGIPTTEDEVRELGELANKTGAAGCLVLGALPEESSREFLTQKLEKHWTLKFAPQTNTAFKNSCGVGEFKESIKRDISVLGDVWKSIDEKSTSNFINIIHHCKGNILLSGIGKSRLVAARMAASLSSLGVPAHYIHASEWAHGELGKINGNDVGLFISHSGNTDELVYAMKLIERKNIPMLAIIGVHDSVIGKMCRETCICYACDALHEPLGGIPTSSITLQNAVVNGVICELIKLKKLKKEDFLRNHPGGTLGKTFSRELENDDDG